MQHKPLPIVKMTRCLRGTRVQLLLSCAASIVFLSACGQSKTAVEATFHDESLAWTFPVPPGWKELDEVEVAAIRNSGINFLKENLDHINIPYAEVLGLARPVLYLEFDDDNGFFAEAEPYDAQISEPYALTQQKSFQLQREAQDHVATSAGVEVRHQEGKLRIDEVPFASITTEVLRNDGKTVFITTGFLLGLIGETQLVITYTCSSKSRCDEIQNAIAKSKFDK